MHFGVESAFEKKKQKTFILATTLWGHRNGIGATRND
jgi:hypothetical protein